MENKFLRILNLFVGATLLIYFILTYFEVFVGSTHFLLFFVSIGYLIIGFKVRNVNIFGIVSLIISVIAFLSLFSLSLIGLHENYAAVIFVGWIFIIALFVSLILLIISFIKN